ncbi:cytochrome P450 2H1-like [Ostrea edulis]|uniref:cytochrome P450 2H1-like n=1 Tax=Ostrea edulis TaxID=37623 RepID=UPI0024AE9156|nr:cytochrome P450 2H1-like [Ostrea edulis]
MENATSSQRVLPIVIGVSSIGAVFVYLIMKIAWGRQYKLPPGPWALPIVGNLPQLHGRHGFYYKVLEFRQTYGDIFRLQMGVHNIMFVFGHQYVQELLCKNGDLVTKRPNWMYVPDKLLDKKGVVWSYGDSWRTMQALLKSAQEDPAVISALQRHHTAEYELFQSHAKDKSSPHTLEYLIRQTAFNFLSAFLLGRRYSYEDPDMIEIRDKISEFGVSMATANKANFLPFLAYFDRSKLQTAVRNQEYVFSRFREIMQAKSNGTEEEPPSDFLQVYLSKSEKELSVDGMTEIDVLRTTVDMFVAGRDNLMVSTKWILMALVKYPDVQSKCRSEIHEVIGRDQKVQTEDRSKTPYTLATIKEIQRMYSPVTLTPFHCPEQDIKVGEYDIPKDSIIMIDCKAPCKDRQFWKDPEDFKPERFLDMNASQHLPEGCYIPYGAGPRYCIGKYLADIFLYTFTANILQNFQVTTRNPEEQLSFENVFNLFGLHPLHFDEVTLKGLE